LRSIGSNVTGLKVKREEHWFCCDWAKGCKGRSIGSTVTGLKVVKRGALVLMCLG